MEFEEELLSLKEVAKILHVNKDTLRRWDNAGRLKAVRVGTRKGIGDRRYRRSDIEKLLAKPKTK